MGGIRSSCARGGKGKKMTDRKAGETKQNDIVRFHSEGNVKKSKIRIR